MTRRFLPTLIFASLAVTSTLTSCIDDIDAPHHESMSDIINFTIDSSAAEWNSPGATGSRSQSADRSSITKTFALESDDSNDDSLFLYMTVEPMTLPMNRQDGRTESRSALPSDEIYTAAHISAYEYKAGTWDGTQRPNLFHLENLTYDFNTKDFKMDNEYRWPGKFYNLRFFCVSPRNCALVTSADYAGYPKIHFTVADDVSDQVSLITGMSDEYAGNHCQPVELKLKHTTATIKFQESEDLVPGTITEITLKNFYASGTYNLETESWDNLYNLTSYTQTIDKAVTGDAGTDITDPDKIFTILPQETTDSTYFEIKYINKFDNTLRVGKAPIKAVFEAGKQYVFSLANSDIKCEYIFTIDGLQGAVPESGDSVFIDFPPEAASIKKSISMAVKLIRPGKADSTITYSSSNYSLYEINPVTGKHDVEIKVANCPLFSSLSITSTTLTTAIKKYAETIELEPVITKKLQDATPCGSSSNPYNLSNSIGAETVENTANCYVVNAPGTYSVPLVYGNSIKNGSPNILSMPGTSTNKIDYQVAGYVDIGANDYAIVNVTNPYIVDCLPEDVIISKAGILWQDCENLITNVRLSEDKRSFLFDIDKSTIHEGNAAITLYDSNNYPLWTWHIWVSNYELGKEDIDITYSSNLSDKDMVMPTFLGWVDNRQIVKERIYRLVFSIPGFPKKFEFYFRQKGYVLYGHSPFWQWGRPMPFMPYIRCFQGGKAPTYLYSYVPWDSDKYYKLAAYCCSPNIVQNGPSTFSNMSNLWNWVDDGSNKQLATDEVKTIYDPCPVGYMVPTNYALRSFSVNTTGSNIDNGFYASAHEVYCNSKREPNNTIVLPKYLYGGINQYKSVTFYDYTRLWTSSYASSATANYVQLLGSGSLTDRSMMSILPMREP